MKQRIMYKPFVNILDMTNDEDRKQTGRVKGVANGMYFSAKVYDIPSTFGINDGRVSKFSMCSSPIWDHTQCFINYSRGWDTEDAEPPILFEENQGVVNQVLKYLEELPTVFEYPKDPLIDLDLKVHGFTATHIPSGERIDPATMFTEVV